MRRVTCGFLALVLLWAGGLALAEERANSEFSRPLYIPFPEDAPYSPQVATLGKMLFFDPRLSADQNMSCASCHNPSFGWETPVALAVGAANIPLERHAPTILNLAWSEHFFWDGRASSLEEQAKGPIEAPLEMGAPLPEVVKRLSQVSQYGEWFDRLFPQDGLTEENILKAIATYERTIVSGWSAFDRWIDGDANAISESAKRGFDIFIGTGRCVECHTGWNFTDGQFHNIGLITDDMGRALADMYDPDFEFMFKTPSLRNIALRAPYMHDGQLPDLRSVISHYQVHGISSSANVPDPDPLELSAQDVDDLIDFLESLTEERTNVPSPMLPAN